jgi:glyoxylase-like metal-dependent hydrolase (beta-lactamase superfamily II)
MRYGDFDIHSLPEGRFTVGLDKVFVPHADGDPMRKGTLFVSVCPFLVETPSDVLLLDCGLGEWAEGRGVGILLENLQRHGLAREQVTKVLLSHLHFDHAGGAVFTLGDEVLPTFPNAEYVVQRGELTAPYGAKSDEARDRVSEALERAGQLVTVEGDGRLNDEISYVHTNGHTRDHGAFTLHSGELEVLFAGDVLPTPGQLRRKFSAKYDHDGGASQSWRDRLGAELAESGALALFYHSTDEPAGFVEPGERGGFRVEPVAL